jgi:hypothetical protein
LSPSECLVALVCFFAFCSDGVQIQLFQFRECSIRIPASFL